MVQVIVCVIFRKHVDTSGIMGGWDRLVLYHKLVRKCVKNQNSRGPWFLFVGRVCSDVSESVV